LRSRTLGRFVPLGDIASYLAEKFIVKYIFV
jgi:hypothetical protein